MEPLHADRRAPADAAVVVGIESYAFLPKVPFAGRDAAAVHGVLVHTLGVPADHVELLQSGSANREQVLAAVRRAASEVASGGRLWVYFAGHGAADPATGERLLLGDDVKADPATWTARAIKVDDLQDAAVGQAVVLILDTCFNGQARGGTALSDRRFAVPAWAPEASGMTVWSATEADQLAQPMDPVGHGAFSYFAVGALRGWADGAIDGARDGSVSMREANEYVARALRTVGYTSQTPELTGQDLVLAAGVEVGPVLADLVARPESASAAATWRMQADVEHIVTFASEPVGATVTVDGAFLCVADPTCARRIPQGRHDVELSLERYDPVAEDLDVFEPSTMTRTLVPRFGWLSVESEHGVLLVRVDDQEPVLAPTEPQVVGFGEHRVSVVDPRWMPLERVVNVEKGEREVVTLAPEPRLGGVKVTAVDPAGNDLAVDVVVDGRKLGRTPFAGELQVGRHDVEVGGEREVVDISEARVEALSVELGRVPHGAGRALVVLGATSASAGALVALDTWALAADDPNTALTATNVGSWSAAGIGAALGLIGAVDLASRHERARGPLVAGGLALALTGAGVGVVTAVQGADEPDADVLSRLQVTNTAAWSTAGAGAVLAVSGLALGGRFR